jgi:succinoglycan biosynthesis transport protein ExoP
MELGTLFSMIRARLALVIAVALLTTATAVAVSLLLPKEYLAAASVVLDPKPDPISPAIYPGMASPAFVNTQVDVIKSERVARRVVDDLALAKDAAWQQRWRDQTPGAGAGTIEQWLSAQLRDRMEAVPSRDSNVITITYRAEDPRTAAHVANAFVQAYLGTTLELQVDPARKYTRYFDQQAQASRKVLEAAQARLAAFQQANGITVADERVDVETARLNELSTQLVTLQVLASESASRQRQAAQGAGDRLTEVLTSPVIAQLKTDLGRAQARVQELSSRYGSNYPQLIEARAAQDELSERLQAETRRISGSAAVANRMAQQREAQLRSALETQRTKVLQMRAKRDQAAVLARDVDSAQRNFDAVSNRLSQTSLESESTQSNVNLLTSALPPSQPTSPKLPLNTALGLVVGLTLGRGLALALELTDRRLRMNQDVQLALQIPLLGVLPRPGSSIARRIGRLHAMERRLLGRGAG